MNTHLLLKTSACLLCLAFIAGCKPESSPPSNTDTNQASGQTTQTSKKRQGLPVWPQALTEGDTPVPVVENRQKVNVTFVVDTSGSMYDKCKGEKKIVSAKSALNNFMDSPSASTVNTSLVEFSGNTLKAHTILGSTLPENKAAIEALYGGSGTPMSSGIELGYKDLERQARAQLGLGSYHLVILGDGEPTDGGKTPPWLDWIVANTRIHVHTIGFCADISVLDRYGVNYYPAANAAELNAAFAQVLAEGDPGGGDVDLNLFSQ